MQKIVKSIFTVLFTAALLLLVLSVPGRAQVLAHSGEIAGNIGYDHTSFTPPDGPTSNHFFGVSGGYNITPNFTALGEYKYDPLSKLEGVSYHSQLYGGAARFNFLNFKSIVPYAVAGVGGLRFTASESGISASRNGYYVNFGGGATIYLARNWGVRPEVRYERQHVSANGRDIHANVADVSGSFFYQWGGTGRKKN
jgi:hypothetical protein